MGKGILDESATANGAAAEALAKFLKGGIRIVGVTTEEKNTFVQLAHSDCRETVLFDLPRDDRAAMKTAFDAEQWFAPYTLAAALKRRQQQMNDQF